jgi:hypothetical protein
MQLPVLCPGLRILLSFRQSIVPAKKKQTRRMRVPFFSNSTLQLVPPPVVNALYTHLISLGESLPIRMSRRAPDTRMPVLIAIVHIRRTMVLEVFPRTLNSVVEPATRYIVPVRSWSLCPWLVIKSRGRRPLLCLHSSHSKRSQSQTNQYRHRS